MAHAPEKVNLDINSIRNEKHHKKIAKEKSQACARTGNSCWMGQAGEQLVGKVSGKLQLSAPLDIGSDENNRKFTKKISTQPMSPFLQLLSCLFTVLGVGKRIK